VWIDQSLPEGSRGKGSSSTFGGSFDQRFSNLQGNALSRGFNSSFTSEFSYGFNMSLD